MAHQGGQNNKTRKIRYPLEKKSYKLLDKIGEGVSAEVYKAICLPMDSALVAIKAIDVSRVDLDNVRRETNAMSLLSHPNILNAHCSFNVDHYLWVVMPFMSAGSLQSIISSSFPDGLSEETIAFVLKETLNALSYLHDQGYIHRDIKAGNILMDSNGSVKLADFGVSASIHELGSAGGLSSPSSMLTDFAGTPYWMAPEVIHSHNGYSFKADIWSFGITAMELAYGRPPLSDLPLSKSMTLTLTKKFRFSDFEKHEKDEKNKSFSKGFKEMVAWCLEQDPSKRPTAEQLLKHSFFRNCKVGSDFLAKNLLQGLPNVEVRYGRSKPAIGDEEVDEENSSWQREKHRRISGWNFNESEFELNPIFPTESEDDSVAKQVQLSEKTSIQERMEAEIVKEYEIDGDSRNIRLKCLLMLRESLEEERDVLVKIKRMLGGEEGGELSREDYMVAEIEKLRLENERLKEDLCLSCRI
ncbi:hypothetical protein UlMin_009887 [Ulmus minor]